MKRAKIIDTFPDFLQFWESAQNALLSDQIALWESEYMAKWPELLHKQLNDYDSQQADWRKIASEKVFPFLHDRSGAMLEAHQNIVSAYAGICQQSHLNMNYEVDPTGVIYIGLGCGAGWATTFQGKPGILFDLESIAECGWSGPNTIAGLIAHEFGHIIHTSWREQAKMMEGDGPWWQLFEEGFAQRCEHLILAQETWHEMTGSKHDWLTWCSSKQAYLASEFLRSVAEGGDIRPFFGSWFQIDGYSQCGYFLGHQAIQALEGAGMSMKEIGIIEDPEKYLRGILTGFAREIPN